jgi:hypothetical protein
MTPEYGQPLFNLETVNDVQFPLSKPLPVQVRWAREFTVMGFAVDGEGKVAAAAVDVTIDGVPFGAYLGMPRGDVADYF